MKNKLIWLGAVLLTAVMYFFENNAGTLTALVCAALLPLLGMLPLLFRQKLSASFLLPASAEKQQSAEGKFVLKNHSILPVFCLETELLCENLRTGRKNCEVARVTLLPKQELQIPFAISSAVCGRVRFSVGGACCRDIFSMIKKWVSLEAQADITVLPNLFVPEIVMQEQDIAIPDSDIYSTTKPGNDPGETFSVREYVPGDAIRKIHWKLSEKTDRTMVREFGLPVVNEVLLLLETLPSETDEEADAITEIFSSISQELTNREIFHHTAWRNTNTDSLEMTQIKDPSDFVNMLSDLMEVSPNQTGSVAARFTEEIGHCGFSHVIVVGSQIPAGIWDLYNGNRISIILPRKANVYEGLQPDGTHILSFDPKSYASDLCRLEV